MKGRNPGLTLPGGPPPVPTAGHRMAPPPPVAAAGGAVAPQPAARKKKNPLGLSIGGAGPAVPPAGPAEADFVTKEMSQLELSPAFRDEDQKTRCG